MSPLLRPVGPLPASVYWVRRALVLALIGLTSWLLISVLPFGQPGSGDAAPPPGQTPSPAVERPVSTASARPTAQPEASVEPRLAASPTPEPQSKPEPQSMPEPAGTPTCPDSVVTIAADAKTSPSPAGKPVLLEIELESTASVACRVTVSPKTLRVTVTSGPDRIWTTAHCADAINSGPLTLHPGKARRLGVVWMGERSKDGCPGGQQKSLPGYYAVDAEFNGIASKPGRFRLD